MLPRQTYDLRLSNQELLQHFVLRTLPDRPLGHIELPSQMIRVPLKLLGSGLFLPVQDDILKHRAKCVGDVIVDRLSVTAESMKNRSMSKLNETETLTYSRSGPSDPESGGQLPPQSRHEILPLVLRNETLLLRVGHLRLAKCSMKSGLLVRAPCSKPQSQRFRSPFW